MIIPPILIKIRGFMTKLTDYLIKGRSLGLWSKEDTISIKILDKIK